MNVLALIEFMGEFNIKINFAIVEQFVEFLCLVFTMNANDDIPLNCGKHLLIASIAYQLQLLVSKN